MPNNWKTYKLGETCRNVYSGGTPSTKKHEYYQGDIPWLNTKEIDFKKIRTTEKTISLEGLKKSSAKWVPENSVIIAMYGNTAGKCAIATIPLTTNQACCNLIIDSEKADYRFIYYSILNDYHLIKDLAVGGAQQNLNAGTIKNYEIILPPLPEQKAIANILSAIDDKIENNLAINKTLEDMAMALYKHWFVDFGPFQDGEFVDSELGRIPKGWEVKKLGDLVEKLSKGTTPRMKDIVDLECGIPFLKVKDINSEGEIDTTGLSFIPESIHLNQLKRSILEKGDLLFSIAGTIGRVSIITGLLDNSNCNQALAFIRLHNKSKYNTLIYNWLKSSEVQEEIKTSIVQGVQANVSLTVLKELQLAIPFDNLMFEFSKKVNPIHDLILDNQSENKSLTTLRDTLLPKLISGEVRLKEFKEQIQTVL